VAIMDWYSRYVFAWEVSVTLDSSFCLSALERALRVTQPTIFNERTRNEFRVKVARDDGFWVQGPLRPW
jgi:putative transposase